MHFSIEKEKKDKLLFTYFIFYCNNVINLAWYKKEQSDNLL